jgi:hypothetical protein
MGTFFSINSADYPALCDAYRAGSLDFNKFGVTKLAHFPAGFSRREVPELGDAIDDQLTTW